ncbi:MAG: ASCH domain-containing protein [Porphyromonadaceae bacterium]|nr:ASCH domain-containing protein [Porphyromonadaceae bacterium]
MKQFILCPECGSVELATIDTSTVPWWTYIHDCKNCGYTIMEYASEWDALPAISVRQPWAYLICAGLKDIENRTWKLPEKYKGQRVLIHAGAKPWTWHAVRNYLTENTAIVFERFGFNGTWLRNLQTSAIIGSVEIVDCVQNHPSIWAEKSKMRYDGLSPDRYDKIYNWVLRNPVLFDKPVLNAKGQLSFFKPKID